MERYNINNSADKTNTSNTRKNNAIAICRKAGFGEMNNRNTTFASLSSVGHNDFPVEAQSYKLRLDWFLILDNWINKTYTVIKVPAKTFTEDNFRFRSDKLDNMLVYINKNDFLENKFEQANFSKYVQKVINYE